LKRNNFHSTVARQQLKTALMPWLTG